MTADDHRPQPRLSRRRLLMLAGAAGAGIVAADQLGTSSGPPAPAPSTDSTANPGGERAGPVPEGARPWSDPATWGGRVPGADDVATVEGQVFLDTDVRVAGVQIGPDAVLTYDPATNRSLKSSGNVVVRGRLEMHPESPQVVHLLTFVGVDESSFVGGGHGVMESDSGLWITEAGSLDAVGTAKKAWTRTTGSVDEAATTLDLAEEPEGWQVGDEVVITPTVSPAADACWDAFDHTTVTAVAGRRVTLAAPTVHAHPAVTVHDGVTLGPEVLNLTRNVAIQGTPQGRAHVFVSATAPQSIRYATLRHLGPRANMGEDPVLGRYGIHFHLCDDGVRGSLLEGTVGRECGSHTFVAHRSHGVTFRDCISHDTMEDAYWWDLREEGSKDPPPPSDDVIYERCVASLVRPGAKQHRLTGFSLGAGQGSAARGCVAVGVAGSDNSSGYLWPGQSEGVWTFEDCVAHNNRANGIFVWQNTELEHVITRYSGYHNHGFGIEHGAYLNPYLYQDAFLYGNGNGSLRAKALSRVAGGSLRFEGLMCDAAGLSDFNVVVPGHVRPSTEPARFERCTFKGHRVAAMQFLDEGDNAHVFDLVDNTYEGTEFRLEAKVPAGSVIRVQDEVRGSIALGRADDGGPVNERWNATVRPVPPFAT